MNYLVKYKTSIVLFIFLLASSFTLSAKAKYYNGYIIMKNGTKIEGQIKSFQSYDEVVKYRLSADAKDQKVKANEIDILVLKSDEGGNDLVYKHLPKAGTLFGKQKILESGVLAALFFSNDKIEGYLAFYDDGYFTPGLIKNYVNASNVDLFVRYPDDKYFTWLSSKSTSGPMINGNKTFRKNFERFAESKCPEIVKLIESKKYKVEDFEALLKDYTANCN